MYKGKKTAVIIAAAGLGTRMGGGIPKQYREIDGKPMVQWSVDLFSAHPAVDHVLVVGRDVPGGPERQDSVWNGLQALPRDAELVLIHDGARPYVTTDVIDRVLEALESCDAVVAAVPVKDTIRNQAETLPRDGLYSVQTPQGFHREVILRAYERAFADGFYGTDDAGLAERVGAKVRIVEGAYQNIKITTKEDLPVEQELRIGSGFDVHAFAAGRKLVLGGVEIPFEKGLAGHSDADVLLHAVMDALLGAAGLGDIGRHFPDRDPAYAGISSLLLLKKVREKLNGWSPVNLDVTLIGERPRIAPYSGEMKKKIASVLEMAEDNINIKGTTTEHLGFTGREEGLACECVCLLRRRPA